MRVRLLVTGGRDFADEDSAYVVLETVRVRRGIEVLISGRCPTGADAIAERWAALHGIPVLGHAADFKARGRKAGPERNRRNVADFRPTAAVAFPGNRGTANQVEELERAGVPVWAPLSNGRICKLQYKDGSHCCRPATRRVIGSPVHACERHWKAWGLSERCWGAVGSCQAVPA